MVTPLILKLPEAENDKTKKVAILTELGSVLYMAKQLDDALNALREGVSLQQELKDEAGMSSNYGNIASILLEKNDLPGAEEAFSKAIELKEKLQDYQALTELYGHRGNVLLMQKCMKNTLADPLSKL